MKDSDSVEKSKFVLMARYMPEITENYVVRPNISVQDTLFRKTKITSELGIYGVIIRFV